MTATVTLQQVACEQCGIEGWDEHILEQCRQIVRGTVTRLDFVFKLALFYNNIFQCLIYYLLL